MFLDNQLEFADGTWAPTATGDNISPNVLDTGPLGGSPTANAGRDLGQGKQLWLLVTVAAAVTSAGAATVDFRLRTDSNANLTTAPVDLVATGAIGKATLAAGYQIVIPVPSATYKRYLGVNANIGTAALTAGSFQADIITDEQRNTKYASAYTLDQ